MQTSVNTRLVCFTNTLGGHKEVDVMIDDMMKINNDRKIAQFALQPLGNNTKHPLASPPAN